MLGYLLLAIATILYFLPKWKYLSYFLYLGFLSDGYKILINPVLDGVKNQDLALIYTFIILFVMLFRKQCTLPTSKLNTHYKRLLLFIFLSFFFSITYYNIPFLEVLQGGRFMLLILSYPILIKMEENDCSKLIRLLAAFTLFMAVVDVIQVVFQYPILPYYAINRDSTLGLIRFYNFPTFLVPFFLLSIFCPSYYGRLTKIALLVFSICILGTLGRSLILIMGATIAFPLIIYKKKQSVLKYFVLSALIISLSYPILSDRFGGDTNTDIANVVNGKVEFKSYEEQNDGNFTYRASWVMERVLYLIDRPLLEQIFGLGLVSDGSSLSSQMYNFIVNIKFYGSGMIQQLRSPDIAYGTMIAYYGFGGIVLFMIFLLSLAKEFYHNRQESPYFLAMFMWIVHIFLISVFSDDLSNPSTFALCFVMLAYKESFTKLNI